MEKLKSLWLWVGAMMFGAVAVRTVESYISDDTWKVAYRSRNNRPWVSFWLEDHSTTFNKCLTPPSIKPPRRDRHSLWSD